MHLYFSTTADILANKGIPLNKVIEGRVEMLATPHSIKEMWKSLQYAMYGKTSTSELTEDEVNKVYMVMHELIRKHADESIPFPSKEDLLLDELIKR